MWTRSLLELYRISEENDRYDPCVVCRLHSTSENFISTFHNDTKLPIINHFNLAASLYIVPLNTQVHSLLTSRSPLKALSPIKKDPRAHDSDLWQSYRENHWVRYFAWLGDHGTDAPWDQGRPDCAQEKREHLIILPDQYDCFLGEQASLFSRSSRELTEYREVN